MRRVQLIKEYQRETTLERIEEEDRRSKQVVRERERIAAERRKLRENVEAKK